jgi:hypothetical protein
MLMAIELPGPVAAAIAGLASGERPEISSAYTSLQDAVLGGQGCLRNDLPRSVPWADAAWGEFLGLLEHQNNHVRSIAGQMLSNLAQSVDRNVALRDLPKVVAATRDPMFVTARHILQAIWKYALGLEDRRKALLTELTRRFEDSSAEKNSTLVRFDIVTGLRKLYARSGDPAVMQTARHLISLEDDAKYRKKYAAVWRDVGQLTLTQRQID